MPVESFWDVIIDLGLAWGMPLVLFIMWYFTVDKYFKVRNRTLDLEERKIKLHKAVLKSKGIDVY